MSKWLTILFPRYVENCKFPKDGSSPKSLRYIGRYLKAGMSFLTYTSLAYTLNLFNQLASSPSGSFAEPLVCFKTVTVELFYVNAAWLLMFTGHCFTEAYLCTLQTRKAPMENYGMFCLSGSTDKKIIAGYHLNTITSYDKW